MDDDYVSTLGGSKTFHCSCSKTNEVLQINGARSHIHELKESIFPYHTVGGEHAQWLVRTNALIKLTTPSRVGVSEASSLLVN